VKGDTVVSLRCGDDLQQEEDERLGLVLGKGDDEAAALVADRPLASVEELEEDGVEPSVNVQRISPIGAKWPNVATIRR
jgi:hypothetical protein